MNLREILEKHQPRIHDGYPNATLKCTCGWDKWNEQGWVAHILAATSSVTSPCDNCGLPRDEKHDPELCYKTLCLRADFNLRGRSRMGFHKTETVLDFDAEIEFIKEFDAHSAGKCMPDCTFCKPRIEPPRPVDEFCRYCGAGIGVHRREGEGTCSKCDPK